jgi:D-proline reductase (dithiol) PrdB
MHDNDQAMRDFAATLPVPEFEEPAFSEPPALREARVAIVTSAALTRSGGVSKWGFEDFHFETLPDVARDLELGHLSPNFDRSGFAADLNVVYPVDRLRDLADQGVIGSVADHHYAFAGNQPEGLSALRMDTGPACAKKMVEDGVDVVLLTPV